MNVKKVISGILSAAMISSLAAINAMAAVDLPILWDIDNKPIPDSISISNKDSCYVASTNDPDGSGNKVISMKTVVIDTNNKREVEIKVPIAYTTNSIQWDFDIYREGHTGNDFYITIYNNNGQECILADSNSKGELYIWNKDKAGTNPKLTGSLESKGTSPISDKKWYSIRIISNGDRTSHDIYLKERNASTDYKLIGTATSESLGTESDGIVYALKNRSTDITYLDNLSWKKVYTSVRDDFDNVTAKAGAAYYAQSTGALKTNWEQVSFGGSSTVLKAINSNKVDGEVQTWQELPAMDKIYVEACMGLDGTDGDGVPYQMGIRPVFEQAGSDGNTRWAEGLRLEQSHEFQTGGIRPGGTGDALKVKDGVLYTVGLVYDKSNEVLRYYFIDNYGETHVIRSLADGTLDEYTGNKNASILDGKRLGQRLLGVSLYLRGRNLNGTTYYGNGYYDYLYIDEAQDMVAESCDMTADATDVAVNPTVNIDYNYIIDPKNAGTATFAANGETVTGTVSTKDGKTLVVTPSKDLKKGTTYTLTVSGVKDLLGQAADAYTVSFTTVEPVLAEVSDVTQIESYDGDDDGKAYVYTFTVTPNEGSVSKVTLTVTNGVTIKEAKMNETSILGNDGTVSFTSTTAITGGTAQFAILALTDSENNAKPEFKVEIE